MPRGPVRPHPSIPLKEAAQVAQAIRDNNAGKPMNRILLAQAMGRSPASNDFRDQLSASFKYGFTSASYNSDVIGLTELGERLTSLRNYQEQLEALRQGMLAIPIYKKLLDYYTNNRLPAIDVLKGALERPPFEVRPEWSQELAEMFVENGREVGFVRNVGGSQYVTLEAGPPTEDVAADPIMTTSSIEPLTPDGGMGGNQEAKPVLSAPRVKQGVVSQAAPPVQQSVAKPIQFFIAYGWDKEAVQQVQNILKRFEIPYVVAQEEANAGRPISQKVHDLMKSCSAGIFIFSADEEFKDKDGKTIWRPRENVIYELGAASLEYGQRIVIFKEKSVYFPSDFSDLGYIEYEKENLQAKAMDLLEELVALKAIRFASAN